MRKEKSKSNGTLRPHYDLDKLEVAALGPGWNQGSSRKRAGRLGAKRRYYATRLAPASPLFSSRRIDKELLADFFMTFARAEYALKEAGYFRADKNGAPLIQWHDFARKIGESLSKSDESAVLKAIQYLADNPPRKQVVNKDGRLTWKSRASDAAQRDPLFLIQSVTTVRNNLFHGGKQISGLLEERDRLLLISCLNLLSYAISLDQDVLHSFEELPIEVGAA
jgi:hypothetical protein